MALSGTITGTCDNTNYTLTCEWSATQSVANNTSSITAKVYLKAPSGWSTQSGSWSCVINGTTVTSGASKTVGSTKVLLGQRTWTVNHASDGTCSVKISFSYSNGLSSAGTYTTKKGSGSKTVTLDQIARTSSFTLSSSSLNMGSSQTVTITRASSSFTHTVQYTFGGTTTTSHTKTTSTSVSFTPPVSLASKIPNATSGTCTVKVTTYNGDTSIGSTSKTFTLKVPSSVKPTVTLATTYYNRLGELFLAGKSTVKVTPTGTGAYSSTIKEYSYSGAGLSGTGSSKTTGTLSAGSYTITVTVKDSRGRTNTAKTTFTAYAYSAPTCSASAYRCSDTSGTASSTGEYVRLRLKWNLSNPNSANTNTKTFTVHYKKSSDSSWTQYTSSTLSGYSQTSSTYSYSLGNTKFDTTSSYQFKFTVTDSFSSASSTCTLSTIGALLNIEANGVGIGKIYEQGKLDIGGNVYITGGVIRFAGSPSAYSRIGYYSQAEDGEVGCTFIANGNNNWLRLNDDKTLTYGGYTVYHSNNLGALTASGNRWGTVGTINSSGYMEIGKAIDFHESDTDTSDYSVRITSSNNCLYVSTDTLFMNGSTIKLGYSEADACTYISNANSNWLRLKDDGTMTWRGYDVLTSNGTQTITGGLICGNYDNDTFYCTNYRRGNTDIGDILGKVGISMTSSAPAIAIEVNTVNSSGTATMTRRFTFSTNYILAHTDNAVNLGSSNYHFKAVYATNGTIQTSDGRYKYILEDVDSQTCYDLIRGMNLYGYSTLNKRIDEYVDTTEISDELQESSQKDMNLHMGFIAQEIEDSELAKYILIKDELEDEDGNKTGEHIYGIDNYGYTTAIHGALQHEIELRDKQFEELKKENENLKNELQELKQTILKGE